MQYFGVPTCPYCKKRVNLIRTWSLKRQGEYRCPRCGGISNIYLSPLVYVFALVAVFAGVFEMVARGATGLFLVPAFGFLAAGFAGPIAWVMADCFLIPAYVKVMKHVKQYGY